jgi:hypothetical protein
MPTPKISIPYVLAGFVTNCILTCLLTVLNTIWWPWLAIICFKTLKESRSRRDRSLAIGAAFSPVFVVVTFITILVLADRP